MVSGASKIASKDLGKDDEIYGLATQTLLDGTRKSVYTKIIQDKKLNIIYSEEGFAYDNVNQFKVQSLFTAVLPKAFVAAEGQYQVDSKGLADKETVKYDFKDGKYQG